MTRSHLTAISRKKPSLPVKWLADRGLLVGRILDYGSGRGFDADHYGMEQYDPHYAPFMPDGKFDTIVCAYVLNVIPDLVERSEVVKQVKAKLKPGGRAYFAIRRDIKVEGYTSRGTYQEKVVMTLPVLVENSKFVIYEYYYC